MADLVRNLRTETVHRPRCRSRGKDAAPWNYAAARTLDDITADTERFPWLHLCMVCLPGSCRCKNCRELFSGGRGG